MNKKVLGIALAFVFLALLATPLVSAKPTSAANNPKSISFMWHSENGWNTIMESKTNPPWAEPMSPDAIVSHTQALWNLNPEGNNYVQIGLDEPIPIDATSGYEGTLYVQGVATSPAVGALNYRVYEKIMWGEGNYIEIMCLERATYDMSGPIPIFYASGTFSGHGEIDGQKVQVTGIREGSYQAVGFVLECFGTIRFAGKAP
jgi:hypothetical protein